MKMNSSVLIKNNIEFKCDYTFSILNVEEKDKSKFKYLPLLLILLDQSLFHIYIFLSINPNYIQPSDLFQIPADISEEEVIIKPQIWNENEYN